MARRPRKKMGECDVPDELRCRRTDSKRWRCPEAHVEGRGYCTYHLQMIRESYYRRKNKRSSIVQDPRPISPSQGKTPQMALDFGLPAQIYDEEDLSGFLNMDSWNGCLSPAEKQSLLCFLPKGEQSEGVVESLLRGHILRFGINPAKKWGNRVCNGELHREALLQNEEKLKACQSQFYRDLTVSNRASISQAQDLKRLCLDICQSDERKFRKQLRKLSKRGRRHLRN
ncbi:hypothetical protein SUGI_0318530 [Cryptomeria japonica]|nr:hypothetical protein SUGI_0318530 [Cryptomeria japonica]